tara:strand:+ start:266 stop:616 length:351 start_codon:yes stop_codon:yes gene_type:complete
MIFNNGERTMTDLIRVPKKFYDDHTVNLSLEAPPVVRETQRHYWIDASSEHLAELLSNASFYADPRCFDGRGSSEPGMPQLIISARATEEAIEKYLSEIGSDYDQLMKTGFESKNP